jgi:hypothetical protein
MKKDIKELIRILGAYRKEKEKIVQKMDDLEYKISCAERDIKEIKIRPEVKEISKSGGYDTHYESMQYLKDLTGQVLDSNTGWDCDYAINYSEDTLSYICKHKEYYDLEEVIRSSKDSNKTRAYFTYKGVI